MMIDAALYRRLGLLALLVVLGLLGCSEKPAVTPTPSTTTGGSTGNGDDDGEDDDGDDDDGDDDGSSDGTSASFDLCDALGDESALGDFDEYVEELCDGGKLVTLRKSEMVYKGGSSAKVNIGAEEEDGNEVSFRLFTSSLVPTSADKYWQMMKLQFFEPDKFDDEFDRDPNLDTYEVLDESGDSSVEYHYVNTKEEASPVDYEAKSDFVELKSGQAYVLATKLTKSNETMKDLSAVIIINAKSSSATEVFVVSDQTYDKGEQETEVARNNAKESLGDEQIRSFENAEKAEDFFD